MTSSEFKSAQIALAGWRGAKNELHSAMLAVVQVLMNRAQAGWFFGDLYENATQWLAENPGAFPDPRDPEFLSMLLKLETVTSGMASDKTGGALWFYPKDDLEDGMASKGFTITTTIGNLVFLK